MASHSVWEQMNYVPPRGQCNWRASVFSPKCPCRRFMLHPLKSTSSFDCDGCAHHASFHSMENKEEDEIRKRWESEAKEKEASKSRAIARPKKRLRELEEAEEAQTLDEPGEIKLLEYDRRGGGPVRLQSKPNRTTTNHRSSPRQRTHKIATNMRKNPSLTEREDKAFEVPGTFHPLSEEGIYVISVD